MAVQAIRKFLTIACLSLIPIVAGQQVAMATSIDPSGSASYVAQSPQGQPSLDELTAGIERHLISTGQGIKFDVDSAIGAGEHELIVEAGRDYNKVVQAQRGQSGSMLDSGRPGMSLNAGFGVWGNWCGPGNSGPGAPVDTLDTLCMRHDKCYAQRGYFSCYCDAQLKAEIDRWAHRMTSKERAMAAAIKLAFMHPVCNPFT